MEDYQIHVTGEPNNYIVVRKTHPNFMAYIQYKDKFMELTKLNLLENCGPVVLSKALGDLEVYLKAELSHKMVI